MFDETLQAKMDRRSFLRGSSLFAAAVGAGLVTPLAAFAQEQQEKQKTKKKEEEKEKPEEDPFAEEEQNPTKQTLLDNEGREYRSCPQCGYNMYRQGRTWTCENCGYSYVE